jgi:hypothetical protein
LWGRTDPLRSAQQRLKLLALLWMPLEARLYADASVELI